MRKWLTRSTIPLEPTAIFDGDEWMQSGNCRHIDPDTFFPSDGQGVIEAQKVCEGCPAQAPCLEYALLHRIEHGVWGGASERQRRRILRERKQALRTSSSSLS